MNAAPLFSEVIDGVLTRRFSSVSGLWGSSKALFLSLLQSRYQKKLVVICPTAEAAEERFEDLRFYTRWYPAGVQVRLFPSWETLPYDSFSPHSGLIHQRMETLHTLLHEPSSITVTSLPAVIQRLIPKKEFIKAILPIRVGLEIGIDRISEHLVETGYQPASVVTQRGEFSRRGGILDIYSPVELFPLRLEFFGDRVESIRRFDPETQRTITRDASVQREEASVFPAREVFGRDVPASGGEYLLPSLYDTLDTLFDYSANGQPENLLVCFDEFHEVRQKTREYLDTVHESFQLHQSKDRSVPDPIALYLTEEELLEPAGKFHKIALTGLPLETDRDDGVVVTTHSVETLSIPAPPPKASHVNERHLPLQSAAHRIELLRKEMVILLTCSTEGQKERVLELLQEYETPAGPILPEEIFSTLRTPGIKPVLLLTGRVSSGFVDPQHRLALFNDDEIFGKKFRGRALPAVHPQFKRKGKAVFQTSFEELQPGDFVVHVQHGIGRYEGLKHLSFDKVEGDHLLLRYAEGDSLYLPVDKLQMVQKYVGLEGHHPSLDRLGGTRWSKTRAKVQKAVEEMARDLLDLYAGREVAEGHTFSRDNTLIRELEAGFEFDETPDQMSAIEAVKRDMERERPMDHLVCGDVGYGKTEVAVRASGKAVMDGKQVAILVPTTLLAQQHYRTFASRFAAFPVRVEVLSRFRKSHEQKQVLKDLAEGRVDILIGTHRLLQKDITFRDLGLVIVDEEQRFGVAQKERLKQVKQTVDVLTLTATPIPRTLQMGLSTIRDMSVIETPPVNRLSIRTILAPFDRRLIREAILREMERNGQVYFVHNRVQSIYRIGGFLKEWVPEAKIGIAHGQMSEGPLERVMVQFMNHEFDILLTTAIIESGLDIPTANTIIINRADQFGLADLYQLRGRVGRSGHQAYAYLLVPAEEVLTEEARKRLKAIQDLTELGSAFRLAMRDMEIRGAGNLLGKQQSGHIAAVGLDLYLEMMEKTVKTLRESGSVKPEEYIDPTLNLKVSAFIPESYVFDPGQRLSLYKRIALARGREDILSLREEIADRFGPIPVPVDCLLEIMELKLLAKQARILKIERKENQLFLTLAPTARLEDTVLTTLMTRYKGKMRFLSEYTFEIRTSDIDWPTVREEVRECLYYLPSAPNNTIIQ